MKYDHTKIESSLTEKLFISTRPDERAGELNTLLRACGSDVISMPMIEITPVRSAKNDAVIRNLSSFNWLLFTSSYGVKCFFQSWSHLAENTYLPSDIKLAVIGDKTAETLFAYGYTADYIDGDSTGEKFAVNIQKIIPVTATVLWPAGDLAKDHFSNHTHHGIITRINVYSTTMPQVMDELVIQRVINGLYDMILFFSPSAVNNFFQVMAKYPHAVQPFVAACIGPATSSVCVQHGIEPVIMANQHTAAGIVEAIKWYYSTK